MNGQFELGMLNPLRYFLGIAVTLGLLFALIGEPNPGVSLWQTLLLWQLQTLTPMALLVASHLLLHRWRWFERLNPWLQLAGSGLLGVLLFTPLGLLLDYLLLAEEPEPLVAGNPLLPILLEEFINIAPPAVLTWLVINAPWVAGFRLQRPGPAPTPGQATAEPAFLREASPPLAGEVIYLKAELHYLLVVSTEGRALVLYNLKDAIAELPPTLGFQCHRSYWVNSSHIASLQRMGRQGKLFMSNGAEIPVSRSRLGQLEAEGVSCSFLGSAMEGGSAGGLDLAKD